MQEENENKPQKPIGKFQAFKNVVQPYKEQIIVASIILLILIVAWIIFIILVKPLPISPTPSLIMVWASVIVLLIGIFPNILKRIKRIKFKDFELELQAIVTKASMQDYISFSDLEQPIFSTKESFSNLSKILPLALRLPNKPVLLVVNLKNDRYISVVMLQIYLFFLDLLGASIFVLFISTKRKLRNTSNIVQNEIVGAVSGRKVLQIFFQRFPDLFRIFDFRNLPSYAQYDETIRSGKFFESSLTNFFQNVHNMFLEVNQAFPTYLAKKDVKEWFIGQLSNHAIDSSITVSDLKTVQKALMEENDFIIICENKKLVSLSSLCFLTKDISKKVIAETI